MSRKVNIQALEIVKVDEFKYLRLTILGKKRVLAGWSGWRRVSGLICDRRTASRVKSKVYKMYFHVCLHVFKSHLFS